MATSGQAKMAIITGWIHYLEFLFSKKSKFIYKSGQINRLDIQWTPVNVTADNGTSRLI